MHVISFNMLDIADWLGLHESMCPSMHLIVASITFCPAVENNLNSIQYHPVNMHVPGVRWMGRR